jgi:hypothetical protein
VETVNSAARRAGKRAVMRFLRNMFLLHLTGGMLAAAAILLIAHIH